MNVRENIERIESLTLRKEGKLSKETLGRESFETLDDYKNAFMVDRDRIINSKAFRRLKDKSQVYTVKKGAHYRNRLTHTLEVSAIARDIGVGIGLNENLIEAIALGHDVGHSAYAHAGEDVLKEFLGHFSHSEQSIRVLTKLEEKGEGLNLTKEVLDGILKHSGLGGKNSQITLEGVVVRYSDKIAYLNHDIDDSIRAGLLKEENLPKECVKILGDSNEERINTLVHDFINNSNKLLDEGKFQVGLSKEVDDAMLKLRKFMFQNIYGGDFLKEERKIVKVKMEAILNYYMNRVDLMPELFKTIAKEEGDKRAVADYVAGMTDEFCDNLYEELFGKK